MDLLRAVLWDLDGTLLDSNQGIRDTFNRVLGGAGLKAIGPDEMAPLVGKPLRAILEERGAPRERIEVMAHEYRRLYNETGWTLAAWHDGTLAIVQELHARGVAQGVVTSKGEAEADLLMRDLGVRHLFGTVVGDDDERPLKPHPAPVVEAVRRLGVAPGTAVMVGDTKYDVQSALAAGVRAVGVLWGTGDRASLAAAHALAADAAQLRQLLLGK